MQLGWDQGWAFPHPGGIRAKALDKKTVLFTELEHLDAHPVLIDLVIDVWEGCRVLISGWCICDTTCRLWGVSEPDIKAQYQWIKDRQAWGNPAPRDTVDCYMYMEYRLMKPVVLCLSHVLWGHCNTDGRLGFVFMGPGVEPNVNKFLLLVRGLCFPLDQG